MIGQIKGLCDKTQVHARQGDCDLVPGKTINLFVSKKSATYPLDDASFSTAFGGYASVDGLLRLVPVGPISGNEPSGGELATSEAGNYGGTVTIGVNAMSVSYQVAGASPCLYKELAKLNRQTRRIFHGDDAGVVWGTLVKVGNAYLRAGFLGTLYVREVEATGTTPYQIFVNVDYSTAYEAERKNRVGTYIGSENYPEGLIGIVLKAGTAAGTATVETVCSGQDITADFATEWDTTMFVSDAGAAPTSVTYVAGILTFAPSGKYKIAGSTSLKPVIL